MKRIFLFTALILTAYCTRAQDTGELLSKAVVKVYEEYKMFLDSSLLVKHVVLDPNKSYWVNSRNNGIRTVARGLDNFSFDEFSLSFAVVYKGDTIRHLPVCRLNTGLILMPLGSPGNPIRHGDVLPPYAELIKGNIAFDYKNLKKLLHKMKLEATAVNLQKHDTGYAWLVTTSCPEIKCRQLTISATDGKILEDKNP